MLRISASSTTPPVAAVQQSLLASALALLLLGVATPGNAANGRGKPPPPTPPNPDIVYMSSGSNAPTGPSIRGVALTIGIDSVSGSDTQLLKALDGRSRSSIAWSPDGTRYAWIEGATGQSRKIMWAEPGRAATVLYQPGDPADPYVSGGNDVLAWAPGCASGNSVLVFAREAKWDPVEEIETEHPAIMAIDIGPGPDLVRDPPRLMLEVSAPGAFAFSPSGRSLAYRAGSEHYEGIWVLPLACALDPERPGVPTPGDPVQLLTWDDLGAPQYPCDPDPAIPCSPYPAQSVASTDWSGDGLRLALSVIVSPDPGYPWRDLRVAYLSLTPGAYEQAALVYIVSVNLDSIFGPASSEHYPQWGPTELDDSCERLAFAQSAGAIDGSDMNGRRLFLLDLQPGSPGCFIRDPLQVPARNPRVLDWK